METDEGEFEFFVARVAAAPAYVVASCTGALRGEFESGVQQPPKWRVAYAPERKQVLVDYRRVSVFIMR